MQPAFVWRKHAKLQTWAEALFESRTGLSSHELNCGELALSASDINVLRDLVEADSLPVCEGGFFFGHQFQDESASEYRTLDLEFCDWAMAQINEGETVYYSCWW